MKNRVAGHSEIEERTIGRNRTGSHSGIRSEIESGNNDLSNARLSIKE